MYDSRRRALAADAALVLQFAVLHSVLLSERGARWLSRLVPLGLGRDLSTTTFATISSWQLLATGWTLYCLLAPLLKERRYLRRYGAAFERYRERVPYWVPSLRAIDLGGVRD